MSFLDLKNEFFYITIVNKQKQVKLFNNILFDQKNASLGVLSCWVQRATNKIAFIGSFLNNYSVCSLNQKYSKVLNFKYFNILLFQVFLFLTGRTLYSLFSFLPELQPTGLFFDLKPKLNVFSYNSNLLSWFDSNKQLFNSNFLTLTFKTTKRNIFLAASSSAGSTLWKKSSGSVGYKGKHKKAPEALRKLVDSLILFLRNCNVQSSFIFRFFFIKSLEKSKLDALNSLLNRSELYYTYIIYDVRQPHGYMRLRKQRRL